MFSINFLDIPYNAYLTQTDGIASITNWRERGWLKTNGQKVDNVDLWQPIDKWLQRCDRNCGSVIVQHVRKDNCVAGNTIHKRLLLRNAIQRKVREQYL